ncbi:MAG TPA: restriction endonuclease subunit S [Candidatus Nanoarchaeia archaeon]|nr:restriction endonuclease subunit S [Candidatus Nanoarchaeia archaeon]
MERVDADYFQPKYSKIIDKIKGYSGGFDSVKNLISLKDKNFIPKDNISYKYIELADVVKCGRINNFTYDFGNNLPTRARRLVSKGDVIISSIKGSSSACALITDELDNSIVSSGFYVISSKVINAETLLVLFKSPLLQELLKRGGSGTILMSIGKKEFQKIKIPIIKKEIQQKISDLVRKSSNLIRQSKEILAKAKKDVENFVESK